MSAHGGSLPHQIPFRALSRVEEVGSRSARGYFLVSSSDALIGGGEIPGVLLIEAMAQLAGAVVFHDASAPAMLSAIDDARVERPLVPGDEMLLNVELEVSFGAMHRFRGTASLEGETVGRGTFVLSAMEASS